MCVTYHQHVGTHVGTYMCVTYHQHVGASSSKSRNTLNHSEACFELTNVHLGSEDRGSGKRTEGSKRHTEKCGVKGE